VSFAPIRDVELLCQLLEAAIPGPKTRAGCHQGRGKQREVNAAAAFSVELLRLDELQDLGPRRLLGAT
jgi:hypothetical protein